MQIALLGCGWLGLPLAEACIAEGYKVYGTTTSPEKENILEKAGIRPFRIEILENGIQGPINKLLKGTDVLIVNIPPKLRRSNVGNFVEKTRHIADAAEKNGIEKILFVSSTSVFGNKQSEVTENTVPHPGTESGKQLLASEQLLYNSRKFRTTILRFAGLIGEDRHPVHHLAGKKELKNPDAPVNLIHRDDCIGIITTILKQEKWGETYNAAYPDHPARKDYYTRKAKACGLPLPEFDESPSGGKIITSGKLVRDLGYTFRFPIA